MPSAPTSIFVRIFKFFASFGLATTVLVLLLLVTWLGTLEQREHGLYISQGKYFESLLITNIDIGCCVRAMHVPWIANDIGKTVMPILLPGGGLLMALLAFNMICGGITRLVIHIINRLKHGFSVAVFGLFGVLLAHISVVFLLVAGLVSLWYKQDGAVWVTEGAQTAEFDSFHRSVIQVEKLVPAPADGKRSSLVIPDSQFTDLAPKSGDGRSRTFTNNSLPFDLLVMNYLEHSTVRRAQPSDPESRVVDGYVLQEMPKVDEDGKVLEHERWMNGAYVTAIDKKSGAKQNGIIWRSEAAPWSVKIGEEVYGVTIGRRPLPLPFTVRLDKFVRETHPGTNQPRKFASHVTVTRNGREEQKLITMNEPLRFGGFAFFQSSFDATAARRGGPQSSMFQVASNPSDHWPLISLLIAMLGLAMNLVAHFIKFLMHISKSSSTAKTGGSASPPPVP